MKMTPRAWVLLAILFLTILGFRWLGNRHLRIPDPQYERALRTTEHVCMLVRARYRVNLTVDDLDPADVMIIASKYNEVMHDEVANTEPFLRGLAEKYHKQCGVVE